MKRTVPIAPGLDLELAKAMEPEAWAEYDAGNGVCTNDAGWKCLATITYATRVLDHLKKAGLLK
jgi:hypothetical protein